MRKTRKDFEEMAKKNSELEEVYDVLDIRLEEPGNIFDRVSKLFG